MNYFRDPTVWLRSSVWLLLLGTCYYLFKLFGL